MPCYICKHPKGSIPLDIVWKNEEGDKKEYCIFHAPKEHKGVSIEEFNEIVFAKIDEFKAATPPKKYCYLDKTIFPGDISFRRYNENNPLPFMVFAGSTFHGNVYFIQVQFSALASFHETEFLGDAIFLSADFKGGAEFTYASFHKTASFNRAHFPGGADFLKATFKGMADFDWAKFGLAKDDRVNAIEMKTDKGNKGQVKTEATANFDEATFKGLTTFESTRFGLRNSFRRAAFENITKFINRSQDKPQVLFIFRELHIIKEMIFIGFDMRCSDFLYTNLANIRFQNVLWEKTPDEVRYCLPIEDDPERAGVINEHVNPLEEEYSEKEKDPFLDKAVRYPAVADFYRQMKKKSRDDHNEAEASLWHFAEKEVQLKILRINPYSTFNAVLSSLQNAWNEPKYFSETISFPTRLLRKSLLTIKDIRVMSSTSLYFNRITLEIYRTISRYGEDPKQALLILLSFVLALAAIVGLGSLSAPTVTDPAKALGASNTLHVFFQYLLLDRPSYELNHLFAAIALLFSRLVIPIQAAIFAFALRNKLCR